jgi:tRNA A-37 threonylcarbamoyl transferase component Bud32
MTTDSTGAEYPQLVWNYAVHKSRQEQLYFWRMGFYPSFVSGEVVPAVKRVMERCGIRSYVLYELFGIHDLLLRVWIPAGCPVERFREVLLEELAKHSLKTCDPFIVHNPVRHWLFPDGQPEERHVDELTQGQVSAVESREMRGADRARLRGKRLYAEFPGEADLAREVGSDGRPVQMIKFAVVVVGEPSLGVRRLEHFERTVAEVLDKAERLQHRSLYAGFGFGHFLILGSVPPLSFYAIDEELIGELNAEHIQEAFESRTYTHISGVRRFLLFREGLGEGAAARPPAAPAPPSGEGPSPVPYPERFELIGKLGEGGYAPVYHVFDTYEKREWALKVFSADLAESAKREVRALLKFDDPRIVKPVSIERDPESDRWYLRMEYVDGTRLDRYAESNETDDRFAIGILDRLLDALIVIHPDQEQLGRRRERPELSMEQYMEHLGEKENAVVHRDIKPSNILVMADGSIKLIDFGIASGVGDTVRTRSGTPPYQPPDATSDRWDVSTDLFAAGVVFYELICGTHPYPDRAPDPETGPIDPQVFRPDLSPAMAAFLVKACMPYRADRFLTAGEMREALRALPEPPV